MICADLIAEWFASAGVDTVFGHTGGRILPLVQSLNARRDLRFVCAAHEQGAAFMAEAYARVRGLGCVVSTSGPGATNLLTGVASAYYDGVPLVAVTGQSELADFGRGGIQEGSGRNRSPDVQRMFAAVTKSSLRVESPEALPSVLARSLDAAVSGHMGPVHVDVPVDVLIAPAPAGVALRGRMRRPDACPEPDDAAPLLRLLACSERPCLVFGGGAAGDPEVVERILRACDRADLPFCNTLAARGRVDETSPLYLGQVGVYGQDVANEYVLEVADLVVYVGVSFQYLSTLGWRRGRGTYATVNIEPPAAGAPLGPGHTFRMSAAQLADVLDAEPPERRGPDPRPAIAARREALGFFPQQRLLDLGACACGQGHALNPAHAVRVLTDHLPPDAPVVLDSGENAYWSMMSARLHRGQRLLANAGLGAMAYAVGAPVGLSHALANRRPTILSLIGDGGLLMGQGDLSTPPAPGSRIVWVVFANGIFGTQKHWQRDHYRGLFGGTDLPAVDYRALCDAMGLAHRAIADPAALEQACREAPSGPSRQLWELSICPELKPSQALGARLVK